MVVDTRFELVTPAMSMQCSTTELIDHPFQSEGSSPFAALKSSLNCNRDQLRNEARLGRHDPFDFIH